MTKYPMTNEMANAESVCPANPAQPAFGLTVVCSAFFRHRGLPFDILESGVPQYGRRRTGFHCPAGTTPRGDLVNVVLSGEFGQG